MLEVIQFTTSTMFVINLISLSLLIIVQNSYSNVIKDDRYLYLFIADHNSTEAAPPINSTAAPTRTTYDWGQWTKTGAPGSRTTYDWGQWTKTQQPGSRTTYDWGQHTDPSRTTYNWGQWTSTSSPHDGNDNSTTTQNPNNDQNHNYRCTAGKYACAGTIGMCISLDKICNGKQDCPHLDDENPKTCYPPFGGNKNKKKNVNSFTGTGFMFHIGNLVIRKGSDAQLFDQQSGNVGNKSKSIIVNGIGNNTQNE